MRWREWFTAAYRSSKGARVLKSWLAEDVNKSDRSMELLKTERDKDRESTRKLFPWGLCLMVVFLDTGVLGFLTNLSKSAEPMACKQWLDGILSSGAEVRVPEIADYELRRELIRINSRKALARLDALGKPWGYVAFSTPMMRRAAEFWASARNAGLPTAPDHALDGDVIPAAQVAVSAADRGRSRSSRRHDECEALGEIRGRPPAFGATLPLMVRRDPIQRAIANGYDLPLHSRKYRWLHAPQPLFKVHKPQRHPGGRYDYSVCPQWLDSVRASLARRRDKRHITVPMHPRREVL
jgi:hypothetical protein